MFKVISKLNILPVYTLVFVAVLFSAGCNERKIQSVKVEAEANQIIDVLGENGIRATKRQVGDGNNKSYEIVINGSEVKEAAAIQLMEDHCLGRPDPPPIQSGTLVTTPEAERARSEQRMKLNIESLLRKLPGATCVEVIFVSPEDRALTINPYPSTASVVINYKTQTFAQSKEDIANLIARSVPALQPQNVNVMLVSKPLRPLPEDKAGTDITRIAIIIGIGLLMILAFVGIFFFLRKRQSPRELPEGENILPEGDERPIGENRLLENKYSYDEE